MGIQYFNANQGGFLGHAKSLTTNDACDVGPVTVHIRVNVIDAIEGKDRPPIELLVVCHDTCIDNEGSDSLARAVVVGVAGCTKLRGGQTGETGGGVSLGDGVAEVKVCVSLNVANLISVVDLDGTDIIGLQSHGSKGANAKGMYIGAEEAIIEGGTLADVLLCDGGCPVCLVSGNCIIVVGIMVDDNVLVRYNVLRSGIDNRNTQTLGRCLERLWHCGRCSLASQDRQEVLKGKKSSTEILKLILNPQKTKKKKMHQTVIGQL
ncbi:hypothetical protein VM1G_12072 [Cytospora mali]|uniref:Uncharacterized protein n=1 Tax=Cytospora mali TaxID=578113 RepID=A0A194VKB6_CYTMA|nr:hypothetical protein VM1G_12072 [Valsa mali]